MALFSGLDRRRRLPELMDRPDLDKVRHVQALRGLRRINQWSGTVRALWRPLRDFIRERDCAPCRLLDLACGAGDLAIGLWRRARRENIPLHVEGWDRSPRAVACARAWARAAHARVSFYRKDALEEPIPPQFDVIACCLFLHHLDEDQARAFLRRIGQAAQGMVLIDDLVRCRAGLAVAMAGTRLLSRSPVVHVDGPRSVRAALELEEVRTLARQAGCQDFTISTHWPWRFLLTWRRR